MSFITNILTPIITGVVILGFILWILFLIHKGIKKTCPNFNFWIKYAILRKKVDESTVKWCMDAISKEMNYVDTEKFLLTKGFKIKKTKEVMYIYDNVLKKMQFNKQLKGGKIENEQLRQSNEQTKLPKIS